MRAALYWTPAADDPLFTKGNAWLGRDAETGASMAQPAVQDIAAITGAPRLYGFHATLRPPMRLRTGWNAFMRTAGLLAARTAPFDAPPMGVTLMDGYLALQGCRPCPPLQALADACVRETDSHRRPADEAELARRRAAGLTDEQDSFLLRWGYPYVMTAWRFHMTLSCRLAKEEQARFLDAAEAHFGLAPSAARRIDALSVFTQREADGPFLIAARLPLDG